MQNRKTVHKPKHFFLTLGITMFIVGCSGVSELANTDAQDKTSTDTFVSAKREGAALLSAFYGLDDAIPFFASYRICGEIGHKDGMPVIFNKQRNSNNKHRKREFWENLMIH